MSSNMFLLSTLNRWSFTKHISWPSKPWLPKFPRRDSWAWIISRRWDDVPWILLSFCVNMGFCWKSHFPWIWKVIWAVSFDSLCEPDPYVDVDDIMGYDPNWWKRNVDHEFTSWSKDLTGHVSPIHVVEWNMSLFWVLNRFTQKINNMLMWHGLPMK